MIHLEYSLFCYKSATALPPAMNRRSKEEQDRQEHSPQIRTFKDGPGINYATCVCTFYPIVHYDIQQRSDGEWRACLVVIQVDTL